MNNTSEFDYIFKPLNKMIEDFEPLSPARDQLIDSDFQGERCLRCDEKDEDNGGSANMVDGRYGLCYDCAVDQGAIK